MSTLQNKDQSSFPLYKVRMTCSDFHCRYYSSDVMAKLIGWNITWQRCRQYRYQIWQNKNRIQTIQGALPSPSDFPMLSLNQPYLNPEGTLIILRSIQAISDLILLSHLSVNAVLCYHSCALIFLPSYRGFLELVTAFQHHCLLCWHQLLLKHWILWSKNQVIQR